MSDLKLKPVVDKYGAVEWILYEHFAKPILIMSDYELLQLMASFKKQREEFPEKLEIKK